MAVDYSAVIRDLETREKHIQASIKVLRALVALGLPSGSGGELKASAPLHGAVLSVLRHGPLTSLQTFHVIERTGLKTTSRSVCSTLQKMADRGVLEKLDGAEDGAMRWRVKRRNS